MRAAVEVLKAAGVYGKTGAPEGEVDPELVMVREARAWGRKEMAKLGPRTLVEMIGDEDSEGDLVRKRLKELQATAN